METMTRSESLPQLVLMLTTLVQNEVRRWFGEPPRWDWRMSFLEASGNIVFDDLEAWRECGVDVLQPVPSIEELLLLISACSSTNEVDPWIMLPTHPIHVIVRY